MEEISLSLMSLDSTKNVSESYNPYQIPPSISLARLHQQAQKLGHSKIQNSNKIIDKCPCCGLSVHKEEFALSCKLEDLRPYISFSHFIFLKLIKQIIMMLMIPYLFIVGMTHILLNIIEVLDTDRVYLDRQMADIVFLLYYYFFCNVYLPIWINRQLKSYYKFNKSISSLTILVEKLPNSWKKSELEEFFYKNFEAKVLSIITFEYYDILKKVNEKTHEILIKKHKLKKSIEFIENFSNNKKNEHSLKTLKIHMKKIDTEIINLNKVSQTLRYSSREKSDKHAFVIFEDNTTQKQILKLWPNNLLFRFFLKITKKNDFYCFKGNFLTISQAPEPHEILFENVGYSNFYRNFMWFFILIIALSILIGLYYVLYSFINTGALNLPTSIDDLDETSEESSEENFFDRCVGSILIFIFNKGIKELFLWLSKLPRFKTRSDYERYALNLVVFCQFMLSIMNTFISILGLVFIISFLSIIYKDNDSNFLDLLNGLIRYYTIMFCYMLLMPLANFLDFRQIFKYYMRYKIMKSPENSSITQEKCNKIFENPDFKLIDFYLQFNYIYIFGVFMWPIFPLWIIFSILTFGLLYYVFKYILLRNSIINKQQSQTTFYSLITLIRKGPFLYSLSLFFLNLKYTLFFTMDDLYNQRILICSILILINFLFGILSLCCNTSRTLQGLKIEQKSFIKFKDFDQNQIKEYDLEKVIGFSINS